MYTLNGIKILRDDNYVGTERYRLIADVIEDYPVWVRMIPIEPGDEARAVGEAGLILRRN